MKQLSNRPIHPFPAKMAPDVALAAIEKLPQGSRVLDPMSGSGTVVRAAVDKGCDGIGFDLDPLAVLISKAWTTPIDPEVIQCAADTILERSKSLDPRSVSLGWIDQDQETKNFVDYWFGPRQQEDLRRLADCFSQDESIPAALKVALSRIIVTKDRGASLARDVSHSRPHRVLVDSDFDVFTGFRRAAKRIADSFRQFPVNRTASVEIGDARRLYTLIDNSIDAVITSPPYLNAIDYIRGHRLSLVWLGYKISDLRSIRSISIGSEKSPDPGHDRDLVEEISAKLDFCHLLSPKTLNIFRRYLLDLEGMLSEILRVLKPGAVAVIVIGNSTLRGVFIDNATAVSSISERLGLRVAERYERQLPQSNRYLPPPQASDSKELGKRMKSEVVLHLAKAN